MNEIFSDNELELINKHIDELPERTDTLNKWNRKGLYRGYKKFKELQKHNIAEFNEGFTLSDIEYGVDKIYKEVLKKICGYIQDIKMLDKQELWYLATMAIMNEFRYEIYMKTGIDFCADNDYKVVFYECKGFSNHCFVLNRIMSLMHERIHNVKY